MKIYRKGKVYFGWDKSRGCPTFKFFGVSIFHKNKISYKLQGIASTLHELNDRLQRADTLLHEMDGKLLAMDGVLQQQAKHSYQMSYFQREQEKLKNINIPAASNHPAIFQAQKNSLAGKDVVIIATGPTLNQYTTIPDAIHMGVNRAFMQPGVLLDYLIIQDKLDIPDEMLINYRPGKCSKLFGLHYLVPPYSEQMLQQCGAARYYFDAICIGEPKKSMPLDLAHQPFVVYGSTAHVAMQLALWTHPRRIFLVGCDCSLNGYCRAAETGSTQVLPVDLVIEGWKELAKFARDFYPDVEICSINPIGLKGVFHDMTFRDGQLENL